MRHRIAAFLLVSLALVVGLVTWAPVARIVRGECLTLRARDFVEAARALGASHGRILGRHVLVNAVPAIIVQGTLLLGQTILIESGLSYLGLGVQPPTPSWGQMIADASPNVSTQWWYMLFPGLALLFTVLAFNFIGDAMTDALNPRARRA